MVLFLHWSVDIDDLNADSREAVTLTEVRLIIAQQREDGRGYLDTLFNGNISMIRDVVKEYAIHPANLEDQSEIHGHYGLMAKETKNDYDHAELIR